MLSLRSTSGIRALATLIVAASMWAPPASAAPVMVYGQGIDGPTAASRVTEFLGASTFVNGGSLDELVKLDDAEVLLLGVEVETCRTPDKRFNSLTSELVGIRELLDQMDYTPIFTKASLARKKLPCIAAGASTQDVYDLFFYGGLAAGFNGDEEAAREWFAAAAAVAPSKEWPTRYPPKLRPLYLEGLQKAIRTPPANLDRDLEGDIIIDGTSWTGGPVLFPGGHLIWVTSQKTGFWVDVPPIDELPDGGIVVTTAANLKDGLFRGDNRYAPWIQARAKEKGWDEVLFVGASSISRFKGGKLIPQDETVEGLAAAKAEAEAADEGARGRVIAGLAMVGAGAGLAAAGLGLNISSFEQGLPSVGEALPERDVYEGHYQTNRVGFGLAIGGGVTAAVGLAVTAVSLATMPKGGVAAAPFFATDGETVAFGISGRLP